ncbi:MAG: hypothetical protein OJF49_001961 [Ktedonobacterales bacterium]|jgi:hypothetical protein|nr:MAG: hypothetical protein OJF49_001961 [Ktedonobacterales bacterium]
MQARSAVLALEQPHELDSATLKLSLFGVLSVLYGAFALYAHGRSQQGRSLPVLCPFRRLTGHRCPLCGFTTATGHLLHGDPRAAFRAHPFAPAALALASLWYLRQLTLLLAGTRERLVRN